MVVWLSSSAKYEKPLLSDAHSFLKARSADWNMIGTSLEVDRNYRVELLRTMNVNDDYRLESVLDEWIKSECSKVSWDHLLKVLREIGFSDTAKRISEWLQTDQKAITRYQRTTPDKFINAHLFDESEDGSYSFPTKRKAFILLMSMFLTVTLMDKCELEEHPQHSDKVLVSKSVEKYLPQLVRACNDATFLGNLILEMSLNDLVSNEDYLSFINEAKPAHCFTLAQRFFSHWYTNYCKTGIITRKHICTFSYILWKQKSTSLNEIADRLCEELNINTLADFFHLKHQPSLESVFKFLKGKSHMWTEFALQFEVPIEWSELELLPSNEEKLKSILKKWIEEEFSEVTWRKVLEVLNTLNLPAELQRVESLFINRTLIPT